MMEKIKDIMRKAQRTALRLCGKLRCMDRGARSKVCWYAALAALLALLGSASHAYRSRSAELEPIPTPEPKAAAAIQAARTAAPEPTPAPAVWMWPLEGEIIGDYAQDTTAWSATLGQWQTHPAVDIAGNPGEAVRACSDGTVADAWQDSLWGNVISIEHPDGRVSTYANLNTLNLVQPGQRVAAGDIISAVGKSAACESSMPWHLHFSVEKDGLPIDPRSLMPEE